ncbi:ABC transporter permease [Kribbella sandramycini]|uniref:ABC transporter permease n=1 Tax=Kribbella sandramycini TaxID=60450 RepID=A0A7Y4NZ04_9ACTN|nr:ABC transporter permease [Kribbella sandramycini]MBB6565238.1 osmoprotectant transport system permease protein [Kribbella sandramycini]NOL41507.1 ABC transporter permease [Kribbella sandramycini]
MIQGLFDFLGDSVNWSGSEGIPTRLAEHLGYTFLSLAIAALIAFPIGLLIGHTRRGAFVAINTVNAWRALPTLGLLTLIVLLIGIGQVPVIIALVVLGVPPILASTYAGVAGVDRATIDAARGMGMTGREILTKVEIPIALPLIISGLRSATLQIVSTATVAAYVALGGLGRYVIDGLGVRDFPQMLAGAVLVALLAIVLDLAFAFIGRYAVSAGLTGRIRKTQKTSTAPAPAGAH